jgi:peptidoglycan/xylan/chitin deacetylase (PgdA/CDA1 family)
MNLEPFYPFAKPWLKACRVLSRIKGHVAGFRVVIFHDVPERSYPAFERVIAYILENHGTIAPSDVEASLNGDTAGDAGKVPCLITFDDGFLSNAKAARTILDPYQIKALFFVCPSLIQLKKEEQDVAIQKFIFDGQTPTSTNLDLMSWHDLSGLLSAGHMVGSHTLTHRRLTLLDTEERKKEINESADILETVLKVRGDWFAWPFGAMPSIDFDCYELIAKRYKYCCSGVRGLNTSRGSQLGILRDPIELDAPFDYQLLSLCGGLDFLYRRDRARLKQYTASVKTPLVANLIQS